MQNFNKLKQDIKSRMSHKMESPRAREIRERNEKSRASGNLIKAKARHERRHGGKKGTSLAERSEWMARMSKDN